MATACLAGRVRGPPQLQVLGLPTLLGVGREGGPTPGLGLHPGRASSAPSSGLPHFWQCRDLWCLCPSVGSSVGICQRGQSMCAPW